MAGEQSKHNQLTEHAMSIVCVESVTQLDIPLLCMLQRIDAMLLGFTVDTMGVSASAASGERLNIPRL